MTPTKGTFEKVPLESSKLSKKDYLTIFLKVLGLLKPFAIFDEVKFVLSRVRLLLRRG